MVKAEIKKRLKVLQERIKERELEACLVFLPLNIFYFTGAWVKGVLYVGKEVTLYVKRPLDGQRQTSLLKMSPLKSLRDLLQILKSDSVKSVGVEEGGLAPNEISKLRDLLQDFKLVTIDDLLWDLRMVKSPMEIFFMKRAGRRLGLALKQALKYFKPGMRELEASAIIEYHLRRLGHPGYTRSANNFELTYGYFISGRKGLTPTPYPTGEGGAGVPGFPGGASFNKRIREGEPLLLDFSGFYRGYYVDQTRMASFGALREAEPFYQIGLEIFKMLEALGRPGVACNELYSKALQIVEKYGFQRYFMAHGERMNFIGHGVGLQIDEPPVISPKNSIPLKEGMTIALEPKFHVAGLGVVGLEDTFVVTKNGLERLTPFPRNWIILC